MATESSTTNKTSLFSWWKAVGLFLGLVLLFILCLLAPIYFNYRSHQQRLQAAIEAIRAAGDPVDGHDLNRQLAERRADPNYSAEYQEIFLAVGKLSESNSPTTKRYMEMTFWQEVPSPYEHWFQLEEIEKLENALEKTLLRLGKLLDHKRRYVPQIDYAQTNTLHNQETFSIRELMRWEIAKFNTELYRRDWSDAAGCVNRIIQLSDLAGEHSWPVRLAILSIGLEELASLLELSDVSEEDLVIIQNSVASIQLCTELIDSLVQDRAHFYQRWSTEKFQDFLAKNQKPAKVSWLDNRPVTQSRPLDCARGLECMTEFIEILRSTPSDPFAEIASLVAKHETELRNNRGQTNQHFFYESGFGQSDYLCNLFHQNEGIINLLETAVALKRFHINHSHFPHSLDELVPDYLESVPSDPYSPKPLLYRTVGNRVRLSCVGENLTDDGGYREELNQFTGSQGAPVAPGKIQKPARKQKFGANDDIAIDLNFGLGDALRRANLEPASD